MACGGRRRVPIPALICGLLVVLGALVGSACSTPPTFVGGGTTASSTGAGGSGNGGGGPGSGGGVSCETATDCPGQENECASRFCDDGTCRVELRPLGFLVAAQAGGDCQKAICDGAGLVSTVPDDADVPSDGNGCTLDVCSEGRATHPAAMEGAACGVGLTCNANGQCAGCTEPGQCGVDTPCTAYTCVETLCVLDYVPAGQGDPGGQLGGDCHQVVCNGSGGTTTVVADADVPVDGNACTADLCSAGAPSNPPTSAGTTCNGDFQCDGGGNCLGCIVAADCGLDGPCASYACISGACSAMYVAAGTGDPGGQIAGDCQGKVCNGSGGVTAVGNDGDVPVDGNACTADSCAGGVPSNPPLGSGTSCGGSLQCNGAGQCVGCVANGDCGAPSACATPVCHGNGSCGVEYVPSGVQVGAQPGGDCKQNVCNGQGSLVAVADGGDVPVDGNPCTADACSGDSPSNPPHGSGTGCPGGVCNGGGSCVQCVSDGACGQDTACADHYCSGSGNCGVSYVAYGQGDPGGQSGGNCRIKRCNGSGGTVELDDPGDTPNDGNACTSDGCNGGTPVFNPIAPADDGNPCTNDVCNPNGGTDHPPVANGADCGDCQSCYSGICYSDCAGCDYCSGDVCYEACNPPCEYCNGSFCQWDSQCGPQP